MSENNALHLVRAVNEEELCALSIDCCRSVQVRVPDGWLTDAACVWAGLLPGMHQTRWQQFHRQENAFRRRGERVLSSTFLSVDPSAMSAVSWRDV